MAKYRMGGVPQFKDLQDVASYLYEMQEQTAYVLNHLEQDNLTKSTWSTVTEKPTLDAVGRDNLTENQVVYGNGQEAPLTLGFPTSDGALLRQNKSGAPYFSTPGEVLNAIGAQPLLQENLKAPSAVNVSTSTAKSLSSFSLAAGVYLFFGHASFALNNTGYRGLEITKNLNSFNGSFGSTQNAVTGQVTSLNCLRLITLTSSGTVYLNAYQTSGSTLSVGDIRFLVLKL